MCVFECVCVFQVEKRLDLVKQVTHSTHKKLTACLQGQQGADVEKRSVKSPSVSPSFCVTGTTDANICDRVAMQRNLILKLYCDIISPYSQKKLPLTILAQCMVEGAAVLGDDSLLGYVPSVNRL